jgi:hypothetical protein
VKGKALTKKSDWVSIVNIYVHMNKLLQCNVIICYIIALRYVSKIM